MRFIYIHDISSLRFNDLTLILLTWRKWWTPNNASKWQRGFNSAFKGLKSDKNNGTLHKDVYTFMIKARRILLRMRNVSDKVEEAIKTYIFFCLFFRKSCRLLDHHRHQQQHYSPWSTLTFFTTFFQPPLSSTLSLQPPLSSTLSLQPRHKDNHHIVQPSCKGLSILL
jgi:hypothetical protein